MATLSFGGERSPFTMLEQHDTRSGAESAETGGIGEAAVGSEATKFVQCGRCELSPSSDFDEPLRFHPAEVGAKVSAQSAL